MKKNKPSIQYKKHSRIISKFSRALYNLNPSVENYKKLIYNGHAFRPQYALPILESALLSSALGYKKVSILEFGCAGGSGLVDIEYHIHNIKKFLDVDFEVYGFDSGEGLPESKDYRDILYMWKPGDYPMNYDKLVKTLSFSKVILGDVSKTSKDFIKKYNPAPIACIFNDLDYYTSTLNSFEILKSNPDSYLPRVFMYFDDTLDTSEYIGELLAIKEFNKTSKSRKIDVLHLRAEFLSNYWKKWNYLGKKFYFLHNFDHPLYSQSIHGNQKKHLDLI